MLCFWRQNYLKCCHWQTDFECLLGTGQSIIYTDKYKFSVLFFAKLLADCFSLLSSLTIIASLFLFFIDFKIILQFQLYNLFPLECVPYYTYKVSLTTAFKCTSILLQFSLKQWFPSILNIVAGDLRNKIIRQGCKWACQRLFRVEVEMLHWDQIWLPILTGLRLQGKDHRRVRYQAYIKHAFF